MLYVWWNFEGVIHWEYVPNWLAVYANLYSEKLERVSEILKRRYPELIKRNRILLQQDNSRTHTTRTTMTIQELGGIELLPHRAYCTGLSDFHLFRSMEHFLRGRNFENIEAVGVGFTEFFASKTRNWYRRGIINLAER